MERTHYSSPNLVFSEPIQMSERRFVSLLAAAAHVSVYKIEPIVFDTI